MLVQGPFFDSHGIWDLERSKSTVSGTFRALLDQKVIEKSTSKGKYFLTEPFLAALKEELTRGMPRGPLLHYPDLTVFDACGIQHWSEPELATYVRRLREHWVLRTTPPS